MNYPIAERAHSINGVPGRMLPVHAPRVTRDGKNKCHVTQEWRSEPRPIRGYGTKGVIQVNISFDDSCKNGHQSFGITADINTNESRRRNDVAAGGCLHEEIVKVFPELEPLIKWHLMQTDGPMHYVSNTVFRAGNRDCWGRVKNEPYAFEQRITFGTSPMTHSYREAFVEWMKQCDVESLCVVEIVGDKSASGYQFSSGYTLEDKNTHHTVEWSRTPFKNSCEAAEFIRAAQIGWQLVEVPTQWGEGKPREFDAARRVAIWPEATDEQLNLDPEALTALLNERLPALIAEFRKDMDACGFLWEVQP